MIAVGVARPRASGQVMTTTVIANRIASEAGRSLKIIHATNVAAPPTRATSTSQKAARSASLCPGALEFWASCTSLTIWARAVSAPTFVARTRRVPLMLIVAPITSAPGVLVHGQALARDHRLVDVALAVLDDAVDGDLRARPHQQQVADLHLGGGDLDRLAVADHQRLRRGEVEEGPDRVVGPAAGPHLEPVAEQHERGQDRRRLVEDLAAARERDHHRVEPAGARRRRRPGPSCPGCARAGRGRRR